MNLKNLRKLFFNRLHPTGQLSIFVILIFQVLFFLFAISLNVSLVVHDKINLQNSVDLAAYYGAMKQAEMLNAIAHINYQIRQSWKLLTWRYRVLGSMSTIDPPSSPLEKPQKSNVTDSRSKSGADVYFVCLGHQYWGKFMNNEVSHGDQPCYKLGSSIPPLNVPKFSGVLGHFASALNALTGAARDANKNIANKCDNYGFTSYLFALMSMAHFRIDQSARKIMIRELAKTLATGKDLDGGDISEGVKKTLENNLTYINKKAFEEGKSEKGYKFIRHNSLEGKTPNYWLTDTYYGTPTMIYSDMFGGPGGGCTSKPQFVHNPWSEIEDKQKAGLQTFISAVATHDNWPCQERNQCNPSAGLYKNENALIFYGVSVEFQYKNQIFLPFNNKITLKAKALAKPFGGRIGPAPNRDPLLPKHSSCGRSLKCHDNKTTPNYSRYPGDRLGLKSQSVHYYWNKALRGAPQGVKNIFNYMDSNSNGDLVYKNDRDPLARNGDNPPGTNIVARKWEMAAIAPDLFDITYFTILPEYQRAYFPKIRVLLSHLDNEYLRGDLGTYKEGDAFMTPPNFVPSGVKSKKTIITYQLTGSKENVWDQIRADEPKAKLLSPFYVVSKPSLLLTGWTPPKQKYERGMNVYDSKNRETNFGHCHKWTYDLDLNNKSTKGFIANGCVYGGRTGYSVKMVSREVLEGHQIPPEFRK